jgi:hypothetical protein
MSDLSLGDASISATRANNRRGSKLEVNLFYNSIFSYSKIHMVICIFAY